MLALKHVSQAYEKNHKILNDVSLAIHQGEFVSIIGPSGAGKTTLLRLFNHMVQPDCGEVWVLGQRMDGLEGRQRRQLQQKIGMIFQDFCLVKECTCLENVLNGCLSRIPLWRALTGFFPAAEREKGEQALAAVGLADYRDTCVRELSGGQKQRVAIARTLGQNASVLLADEPVASLDPLTAEKILSLLKELQVAKGLTIVMNSHNVDQAKKWSDRIIGLKQGRIFFAGTPEEWTPEKLLDLYGNDKNEKE